MFGATAALAVNPVAPATSGYLFDASGLPAPAAAYSLRKLKNTATNAIRIRRTSDGAQTDIGFTAAGHLNTSAITAHCTGGSSGYVVTWYDQSGNSRNLSQTDTTKQFRIYNGTTSTIHTQGSASRPALLMTDAARGMITAAFTPYVGTQAAACVVATLASGATTYSPRYASMFPTPTTAGDNETIGAMMIARNGNTEQWGLGRGNGWRATTAGDYDVLQQVHSQIIGATHVIFVDGVLNIGSFATDPLNISRFGVGHRGFDTQSVPNGYVSEVFFWETSLINSARATIAQSQNAYYGITPTGTGTEGPSTGLDWDALGYDTVYDEDFTTGYTQVISGTTYTNTLDPTHWTIYGHPNGTTPGNDGIGFRNPNKVKVANGTLRIEGLGDVGGGIAKKNVNGSNMQYGGGEIRWRISDGQGYNPKLVLFPASGNWPWAGVIYLGEVPKGSIDDTMISKLRKGDDIVTKTEVGDWTQWHTTSWIWTSTAIEIYLDGELFWRDTSATYQPTEPLGLVIHYDVGDGDPVALRNASTPQPSFLEIDRILLTKKPGLPDGGGGDGGFTDLPNFNLSFVETFDTVAAEGEFLTKYPNWGAYPRNFKDTYGGQPGRPVELQSHYEPNIISVGPSADGVTGNVMKMRLHVGTAPLAGAPADNKPWGAAPYPRLPGKKSCRQTFGRYEAKFRVIGPVQGWKTAWLLWNTRTDLAKTDPRYLPWPYSGEVDWPEGSLTKTMEVFHHNYAGTSGGDQVNFKSGVPYTGWHIWAMEWKPNFCRFILDGDIVGTVTSRVCNEEMRFVMQTETNLGNPRPIAGQQCVVEIAYFVVWSFAT
jgi:hypothetical protein